MNSSSDRNSDSGSGRATGGDADGGAGAGPRAARAPRIVLGDVEISRVVEWRAAFAPTGELVPDAGPALWEANRDQLAPDHWDPGSDRAVVALQTWILRVAGLTVLIDPGVGNGRERPGNPLFHMRDGDLPGRLERDGLRAEDVDIVVNTHVHADHVGWNTRAADGEWVPTFPNARYLIPAADDAYFGPAGGYGGGVHPVDRLLYEDSVAPVHRAGQAELWEGAHRVGDHITLEAVPGHTPGSSVLRVESGGERAVFVGDLLHSPVQILGPGCSSCFCLDPREAAAGRRRVLGRAADRGELVVPAHFGGAGALEVRHAHGGGFAFGPWADWR